MSVHFGFPPDALRARQLDQRMRGQLADSLEYLRQALGHGTNGSQTLDALVGAMHAGHVYPPSTFGLYYELATALLDEEEEASIPLLDELAEEKPLAYAGTRIMALDAILPVAKRRRYQRLMDTDPARPFHILSPPPGQVAQAVGRVDAALARLRKTIPELAGEFEALIRELVLVVGAPGRSNEFAGGSCYMLWGALFINTDAHENEMAMIEALVHESAHSLLFGFTIDEPLIENPDNELYDSPLRSDPRPMDGIYHATFVSARMHWALSALLASELDEQERHWLEEARERDYDNFYLGYDIVARHARLTDTGRHLIEAAAGYMQASGRSKALT